MKIYVVCEVVYYEYDHCLYYSTERKALDAFYTRIGEYMLNPHYSEIPTGKSEKDYRIRKEWANKQIDSDVIKVYSIELDSQEITDIDFWTHPERHWQ